MTNFTLKLEGEFTYDAKTKRAALKDCNFDIETLLQSNLLASDFSFKRTNPVTNDQVIKWCFRQFASEFKGTALEAYERLEASDDDSEDIGITWAYDWQDYDNSQIWGKINDMIWSLNNLLGMGN